MYTIEWYQASMSAKQWIELQAGRGVSRFKDKVQKKAYDAMFKKSLPN
jgi:hypothetical protein